MTDSASSATAYLCGVKTNIGTIGVDASARRHDCPSQKGAELTSILDWSIAAGMSKDNLQYRVVHVYTCMYVSTEKNYKEL